jgi:phosphatidylserine decarboxylase
MLEFVKHGGWGIVWAALLLGPMAFKWQLRPAWSIPWIVGLGGIVGGIAGTFWGLPVTTWMGAWVQAAILVGASAAAIAWRFYRDPERVPPSDPLAILSPADGVVLYVQRYERGETPGGQKGHGRYSLKDFTGEDIFGDGGVVIGIGMSFLDVHVNRAPIGGRIELVKRIPGEFRSLKRPEALLTNERALIVIRSGSNPVGIVQIASRLVRQIVSYVREGDTVAAGQRIGMIRFGSQVDLILPSSLRPSVVCQPGQQVYAGGTIVARTEPA